MQSVSPTQICKGLGIFGPVVSNIPGPDANDGASAGVRWRWLGPAVQIRASPSTGVSPALPRCLSLSSINWRRVLCPCGRALLFGLNYCCQEGRESSSLLLAGLLVSRYPNHHRSRHNELEPGLKSLPATSSCPLHLWQLSGAEVLT